MDMPKYTKHWKWEKFHLYICVVHPMGSQNETTLCADVSVGNRTQKLNSLAKGND